jgi:hypothetical protein
MTRWIAWLLAVAHVMTAAEAHAQGADEALTKEGVDLRRAGRDAEALAVFERALAVDGSPRTRAQVALAEQALGLWVEAERDLSTALAAGDGDGWFQQHQGTLRAALGAIRSRLATLDVEANVAGAELWIDGARAGILPLRSSLRVVAGAMTVEVRAPGFETQTRELQVAPETQAREVVDLGKMPDLQPVPDSSVPPAAPPAEPSRAQPAGVAGPAAEAGSGMRTGAWVSLGGAVALLAGAGAAVLVRNTNAAAYNDDSHCFHGGLTRDQRCGGYRDAASTAQTMAVIEFEAAAATVGVAVVLFSLAPRRPAPRVGAIECSVGMGVACGGSF